MSGYLWQALWLVMRAYVRILPAPAKLEAPDRSVLERAILRALFVDLDVRAIMLMGCAGYTAWYPTLFRARPGFRFASIDPDPEVESYGARGDHRMARFDTLLEHADEHGRFDVVLVDGTAWDRTDTQAERQAMIEAAHRLLRPGGRMIVRRPKPPTDLAELIDGGRLGVEEVPGLERARNARDSSAAGLFACFAKLSAA
ncbi:MAG: class I SAM-dependent methyltransferase [Actinomycetota bacterium]|nr:class I SAM-dependent methyltransferase [Actinomycetota bacterium]